MCANLWQSTKKRHHSICVFSDPYSTFKCQESPTKSKNGRTRGRKVLGNWRYFKKHKTVLKGSICNFCARTATKSIAIFMFYLQSYGSKTFSSCLKFIFRIVCTHFLAKAILLSLEERGRAEMSITWIVAVKTSLQFYFSARRDPKTCWTTWKRESKDMKMISKDGSFILSDPLLAF